MVCQICSRVRSIVSAMAVALRPYSANGDSVQCSPFSGFLRKWLGSNTMKVAEVSDTQIGLMPSFKRNPVLRLDASRDSIGLAQELSEFKVQNGVKYDGASDLFDEMKQRFLSFKKHNFLAELQHFQTLAEAQSPKFMVIGCADSRVCPSNILGFRPGEAFMIRNVANLVPPLENGPSETNAALEFAVNTLEIENILIIGHSSCGGIEALMSMQDDEEPSSLIQSWVRNGKDGKLKTKADATHLSFEQQCRHCEKESLNRSLLNLLTYPWIEDRVRKELLSVHGGYYDFMNCTFEKWTLDFKGSKVHGKEAKYSIKDRALWC